MVRKDPQDDDPRTDDTLLDQDSQSDSGDLDGVSTLTEVDPSHYEVLGEMARGGMGRIVESIDQRAGRKVAVKEVRSDLLKLLPDSEAAKILRRFEREARITARLQHPSIVPVYEIGQIEGRPFFAMKQVDGRPLGSVITELEGIDDRLAVLPKIIAIADALAYAHERGVIHRDLKPANVLVGEHGETVVIDWGLAKQLDEVDVPGSSPPLVDSADGLQTRHGAVLGTPHYMPPEQAAGVAATPANDVYAIGAMLYHLLAGHPPFSKPGETMRAPEVLTRLAAGPPPSLRSASAPVPSDLVSIVEKAMARDISERYNDAGELASDLTQFQAGQMVGVHDYSMAEVVVRWVRRHRAVVATGVIALAVVIALSVVGFRRVATERDRAEGALAVATTEREQAIRILASGGRDAVSRDEAIEAAFRLVQAAVIQGSPESIEVLLAEIEARTEDTVRLASDREVQSVAYGTERFAMLLPNESAGTSRLEIRAIDDGSLVSSFELPRSAYLSLSSDASLAVIKGASGLALWDVTKGRLLHELACAEGRLRDSVISPIGDRVVLVCSGGVLESHDLEGKLLARSKPGPDFTQLEITDDGTKATGTAAGYLRQLRMDTLEVISSGLLARGSLNHALDGEHSWVGAVDDAGIVRMADLRKGVQTEAGSPSSRWDSVALSGNGKVSLFLANRQISVRTRAGQELFKIHPSNIATAAINQDASLLAWVDGDQMIRMLDLESGVLLGEYLGPTSTRSLTWIRKDRLVVVDGRDGALLINPRQSLGSKLGELSKSHPQHAEYTSDGVLFSGSGETVVFRRDSSLHRVPSEVSSVGSRMAVSDSIAVESGILDVKTGEVSPFTAVFSQSYAMHHAKLSADGRIVVRGHGNRLVAFDAKTRVRLRDVSIPIEAQSKGESIMSLVVSSNGSHAYVGMVKGRVLRVSLEHDTPPELLTTGPPVRSLEVDVKNQLLLVGAGTDLLFDLNTKTVRRRFAASSRRALLSPSGRFVVRNFLRRIEIHDLAKDEKFVTPPTMARMNAVLNDSHVLIHTLNGLVEIRDLHTKHLKFHRHHGHSIQRAALAPDASEYSVASEHNVYRYRIPTLSSSADELAARLRATFSKQTFEARYVISFASEADAGPD